MGKPLAALARYGTRITQIRLCSLCYDL